MAHSLAQVGAPRKLPVAGLAAGQQRLQLCPSMRQPPDLHSRQNRFTSPIGIHAQGAFKNNSVQQVAIPDKYIISDKVC